ncbi:LOW QUALITY PROTEIN: uncharacterized protein LOC124156543 [Ischnura elegans]|uniref:LOW QUALITY PROTEIN: uncharacterized protein LOC124156543 n=1 Tax=Ischnura elegans TaxID=197161 RepID=UPI001ED8948A|nr:LOW QUALITY PROTEIN: uncharacterized protein LOC124156543 [Ischnura elegans]
MGNQISNEDSSRSLSLKIKDKEALQERNIPTHPVEKLAKALVERCSAEENCHGISCRTFTKYVFPTYPRLAELIYQHFLRGREGHEVSKKTISAAAFQSQADKVLTVMSDERQIELYLRIFSGGDEVRREVFHELLATAFKLAMDHYPEGGPQTCPLSERTLNAVVDSAFHRKQQLSVSFLARWIIQNCPRLLLGLHKYIIHCLSTAHRTIAEPKNLDQGIHLSTPVLERTVTFPDLAAHARESSSGKSTPDSPHSPKVLGRRRSMSDDLGGGGGGGRRRWGGGNDMLPVSQVWILACALPQIYTRPSPLNSPTSSQGLSSLDPQGIMARMLGMICPSHWVLLYNSREQGLGANRFMHHVLNYRGPSLTFLQGDGGVEFCLASTDEWKESNHYWGQDECSIIQLLPLFHIIESGPKLLYMNTSIRGYPFGIRAGKDPRKPSIEVNQSFSVLNYCGIPYPLLGIEVWGCGTTHSREAQLDVKKWEVKQAEKQRKVKLTSSDWVDHPDRYLLELAGRQSYNK